MVDMVAECLTGCRAIGFVAEPRLSLGTDFDCINDVLQLYKARLFVPNPQQTSNI